MNFDPNTLASFSAGFAALYAVARFVSHLTPPTTIVGKACAWILGNVKPPTQP